VRVCRWRVQGRDKDWICDSNWKRFSVFLPVYKANGLLLKQDLRGCSLNHGKYLLKEVNADQNTRKRIVVPTNPVQISLPLLLIHENQNARAPIEGRNWKQIECSQKQVQRKESPQNISQKSCCAKIGMETEHLEVGAGTKPDRCQKHKSEVCGWSSKSHPTGAARVPPLPERVVWSACPAHHSAEREKTYKWDDHHTEGRSPEVR